MSLTPQSRINKVLWGQHAHIHTHTPTQSHTVHQLAGCWDPELLSRAVTGTWRTSWLTAHDNSSASGKRERHLLLYCLTGTLTSGLNISWRKYSNTNIFKVFSVRKLSVMRHSDNLPPLISWSSSKPHPSTHLYCFPLSNFFHAPRSARTPKLCCCVPAYQQACRPVQERDREEERKREGSQLRLGNGRVNVSACVCSCTLVWMNAWLQVAVCALALACACVFVCSATGCAHSQT